MIFLKIFEPLGSDFVVYYEAAKMFLLRLNPYKGLFTRTFPYNYPPPSLLFLWPLGFFGFETANILWNILSVGSLLLGITLLFKLAAHNLHLNKIHWLLGLFLLFFLYTLPFFPVKFNLGNGQINNFIFLFYVLAIYFNLKNHQNLSAFFLAFAVGIKIAPIIFVLYWLIKGDWRQIIRLIIWLLILEVTSLFIQPWSYQLAYLNKVLPLSFTLAAKDWYYNQSLEGFLARSFHSPILILLSTYGLSLLIILLTWVRGRNLTSLRLVAGISSLYLIIHPIALQHYFVFSIIPMILLGAAFWPISKNKVAWLVLILSYLLIAFDIKNFNLVPRSVNFILSHDFYGIVLLWLLALWKEKIMKIIGFAWIIIPTATYILMLLCRAKICL